MLVTSDPHTPEMFRAIGPVSHHLAFAEIFECEPGSPMVPENQCVLC